ncbi:MULTISPECIES: transposase [Pseudomonas]|uniref:transposase n=1 Tax=Pseudomonas TaxID=286 RepID=UPI00257C993F|nr:MULTISPECIES: transposase [Pseudomonas]
MSRRARITLSGVPLHLIQRGNNRSACFYADEDYLFYLDILAEQAKKHGCAVHAWCLMTNHVHLLLTPESPESSGMMMKGLGQRYVQYVNRTYQRSGTLWEGRFRSCLMQEDTYVLACYQYIEMNPVRAGMVEHPSEYRWSSYRANAQNEPSKLRSPHPLHQALSRDEGLRGAVYQELFRYQPDPGLVDDIRRSTNGNYALGSRQFAAEVEAILGRRVIRGKSGRPKRTPNLG